MKWRVINPEKRSGYLNQAIVEAIMILQNEGKSPPTIFFYQWEPSAVAIGNAQAANEVCRIDECKKLGIDVIRRFSGGGSVYLDSENCFTYSVIAPSTVIPGDIKKSYEWAGQRILRVLHGLGINGVVVGNDVLVSKKKISGMSQAQIGNSVMVGGTMLIKLDWNVMEKVLIFDMEKMRSKGIQNPRDAVVGLSSFTEISMEELVDRITREFTNTQFQLGEISAEELELAQQLEKKYKSKEWVFKR